MHVRVRIFGKPDTVVVVDSMLTKIEQFRQIIKHKFGVQPKLQRLLYGGKILENGYTFFDYKIKLNDVIQLMVKMQPDDEPEPEKLEDIKSEDIKKDNEQEYTDAESRLYAVGDFVDMRDVELGAWFEGIIVRIVYDPKNSQILDIINKPLEDEETKPSSDKENDAESNVSASTSPENKTKKKGIEKYFSRSPKLVKKKPVQNITNVGNISDGNFLYKIQLDDEDKSNLYSKLKDIRPRARKEIAISDLKVGQKVMINHNPEDPLEKGYWYDFKVDNIKKVRKMYELVGTLYLGPEEVPQNDVKARIHDKIFAIEEVVPLAERTEEYQKMMVTEPPKRALPLTCLTCRDIEDTLCKDCGCYVCSGKEFPERIVLCDECDHGYHMGCLSPPLNELPTDDWYCPSCKRDPNEVVAPGAAKQAKKTTAKTTRDWGRGMACVGKTKECLMPPNHFGPIPGIEVGMCWRFRIQLSESGVHRPPVSGIHGRDTDGAYSIVLSGGYEDDVDHGNEFTYTGSGGRDLSGNKRTAGQSCDQTLTRENRALARNCAAKHPISEQGGDAGDAWRQGKPVRVVRSYKMIKHFPKYAPKEGIRYDGIYKVVKYYPEQGLSGFRVWKYLLRRDDPAPAPWEPNAKQFDIVYPDGYLEAEAEKKALKELNSKVKKATNTAKKAPKKRTLRERNRSSESDDNTEPAKRRKSSRESVKKTDKNTPISNTKDNNKTPKESTSESESEENTSPLVKKNSNSKPKKNNKQILDSSSQSESEHNKSSAENGTNGSKTKKKRPVINSSSSSTGSENDTKSKGKTSPGDCAKRAQKSIKQYFDTSLSSDDSSTKKTKPENNSTELSKKRKRQDVDESQSSDEATKANETKVNGSKDKADPPAKKKKIIHEAKKSKQPNDDSSDLQPKSEETEQAESSKGEIDKITSADSKLDEVDKDKKEADPIQELIQKDTINVKLWEECLDALRSKGKKAFTDHVFQVFMCNICQGLVVKPVTTPCQHNFCLTCLRSAFRMGAAVTCPCCRRSLPGPPTVNGILQDALQLIFPGYAKS